MLPFEEKIQFENLKLITYKSYYDLLNPPAKMQKESPLTNGMTISQWYQNFSQDIKAIKSALEQEDIAAIMEMLASKPTEPMTPDKPQLNGVEVVKDVVISSIKAEYITFLAREINKDLDQETWNSVGISFCGSGGKFYIKPSEGNLYIKCKIW